MSDTISIIRGVTTRIPFAIADDAAGTPVSLSGKIVFVRLKSGSTIVELTEGAGVTLLDEAGGLGAYDVTPGNLTTLGDPQTLDVFFTIQNGDNSIFAAQSYQLTVSD